MNVSEVRSNNQEALRKTTEQTDQTKQKAAANQTEKSVDAASANNVTADNGGVHMTLSKDAIKALSEKSTAAYNSIVKDASSNSGALSEDVMNRFKASITSQSGAAMLAQANSSPQTLMALFS